MIKKLSKYGNSHAVLIDKPILELLNIDEKTMLKIITDGKRIIIEPVKKGQKNVSPDTKVQKKYEQLKKKYKSTLQKLAKNEK